MSSIAEQLAQAEQRYTQAKAAVAAAEAQLAELKRAASSSNFQPLDTPANLEAFKAARARVTEFQNGELANLQLAEGAAFRAERDLKQQAQQEQQKTAADTATRAAADQGSGAVSAGATVASQQTARANGASVTNPPPGPLASDSQGTVTGPGTGAAGTAQITGDQQNAGTDEPVRGLDQTQSIPPQPARPGGIPSSSDDAQSEPSAVSGAATDVQSPQQGGVARDGDDNTGNAVRNRLNQVFSEVNRGIVSQPNVLDRYPSYTYNIELYVLTPAQYREMQASRSREPIGRLLLRSGGAPPPGSNIQGIPVQTGVADVGEVPGVTSFSIASGRSQFFPLDFYIDDIAFTCFPPGKGTGGSHNVQNLNFIIVEPNGISLFDRLYDAARQVAQESGQDPDRANYAAQTYLMVIRFFGYDNDGRLIGPIRGSVLDSRGQSTNPTEPIIKFIPFQFNNIVFTLGSGYVQYRCEASPLPMLLNLGTPRGRIPYDIGYGARTLRELFGTSANSAQVTTGDGREQVQEGATASGLPREARGIGAPEFPTPIDYNQLSPESGGITPELGDDTLGEVYRLVTPPVRTQTAAPPKADAASGPKSYTSLVDALNAFQEYQRQQGIISQVDQYEFRFQDPILAEASIVPPGPINKRLADMPAGTTAGDLANPAKGSVDFRSKLTSATAGTSVVQFIDQYTRNSTYITQQQTAVPYVDTAGVTRFDLRPAGFGQTLAWYRIGLDAQPLQYDYLRRDYAYRITFTLAPYLVNELDSAYFPTGTFRGVHKTYNWLFTGKNTSVLDFSQEFNYLYFQTISGRTPLIEELPNYNRREYIRRLYQARSVESGQGAPGPAAEPAANAAEFLFSPGDQGEVTLRIVGDPAWIQQGELWQGVGGFAGTYTPWLADGTVNYDAGEALFQIFFNKPVDYDLQTGLMDASQKNFDANRADGVPGEATQNYVYRLRSVENTFTRGQFTQSLSGTIVRFPDPRPSQSDSRRVPPVDPQGITNARDELLKREVPPPQRRQITNQGPGSIFELEGFLDPTVPQPLDAAQAPTSSGQVIGPASTPLFGIINGGASGSAIGAPSVQVSVPGQGTVNITSATEIDRLLANGEITALQQVTLTRNLTRLQQLASSPTQNQATQQGAKET